MASRLVVALAVVLGFWGGPAAGPAHAQQQKITVLANYVFHGRHSPFFVGVEKGFFKEAGFDAAIQPSTGSGFVITAIDSGKADYGMADVSTMINAIAKGAKVKGVMVFMDQSTSGLASLKPYAKPADLAGTKIAASLTDSARVIVPIIANMGGLDMAKVQWQTADPGVYISLLMSGQADLYTASIDGDVPALRKVAEKQGKQVHFASFPAWGYDVFGFFMIGSAERIAKNPDEAKRFAAAMKKAVEWSIANPEETAKIMVKHNPTLDAELVLAQWSQSVKVISTDYVKKHGYGVATQDRLQRSIDLVKQALKVEAAITADQIYFAGIAPK